MNLDLKLIEYANKMPQQLALGWESESLSYEELNNQVQSIANHLYSQGIRVGDRVGIILDNSPEFVISYYACMRVGAISVPINSALTAREIGIILNDSKPKKIIADEQRSIRLKEVQLNFKPEIVVTDVGDEWNTWLDQSNLEIKNSINLSKNTEDCTLLYTSGTTGTPKGAILTHENLFHNAKVFSEALDITANEKTLIVTPLAHISAQSNCLNATLVSGGYNYLVKRWKSTTKIIDIMKEKGITYFFGPPTVYTYILNYANDNKLDLNLRVAYTGGASLPKDVFINWKETLGFEIVEGYGLTEAAPVVCVNPLYGEKRLGSVGLPLKDVHVKIVNNDLEEVNVKEEGELLVQGPNVMKGYFNLSKENENVFHNGWLRTGDIAKKDEDGYLYIVDRKKSMIIRSGFNIYPREVEEVLFTHPEVLEVAVIGIPHPEKGEVVKAFAALKQNNYKENISEELIVYCKERLATYKVPSEIEIVLELPKTSTGKIFKRQLQEDAKK